MPPRGSGPDPDLTYPHPSSIDLCHCILQSVSMSFFQTASKHFKRQHFMAKRILNQIQAFFLKNEGNRQIPRETPKALPASSIYHPWFFHGFFPSKMTTGYHRSTSVASPKILANGRSASVPKMVKRCQKMSEIALRNLSFADLEPWRNGVGYKILIDVIYIYKVTT